MKNKNIFWGLLFLMIGLLWIFNNAFGIKIFNKENFWPVCVLIPGLCFEITYLITKKTPVMLIPGGILVVVGTLFLFEQFTNWKYADKTWPVYPLAVAIGLFQFYVATKKKALLALVIILALISLGCFSFTLFGDVFSIIEMTYLVPGILIIVGLILLFNAKGK